MNEEDGVRIYTLCIMLIAGPIATTLDFFTIYLNNWNFKLQFGPALRTISVLAIDSVMRILRTLTHVVPRVFELNNLEVIRFIILIASVLFSCSLIAR